MSDSASKTISAILTGFRSGRRGAHESARMLHTLVTDKACEIDYPAAWDIFAFYHGLFASAALTTSETAELMEDAMHLRPDVREKIVRIQILDWTRIATATVDGSEEGRRAGQSLRRALDTFRDVRTPASAAPAPRGP